MPSVVEGKGAQTSEDRIHCYFVHHLCLAVAFRWYFLLKSRSMGPIYQEGQTLALQEPEQEHWILLAYLGQMERAESEHRTSRSSPICLKARGTGVLDAGERHAVGFPCSASLVNPGDRHPLWRTACLVKGFLQFLKGFINIIIDQ